MAGSARPGSTGCEGKRLIEGGGSRVSPIRAAAELGDAEPSRVAGANQLKVILQIFVSLFMHECVRNLDCPPKILSVTGAGHSRQSPYPVAMHATAAT